MRAVRRFTIAREMEITMKPPKISTRMATGNLSTLIMTKMGIKRDLTSSVLRNYSCVHIRDAGPNSDDAGFLNEVRRGVWHST
jgi:hypothetical protein